MILTTTLASAQIDLHCHMIPDSYLEAIKAHGMEMDEGFPIPAWGAEEQLQFMDEAGIRTSVLTMPAPQPFFGDGARAILNMVAHDVLVRYPDLKVVVPHCGSFLPNALPRFKGLLPVMVKQGYMQPVDVDANISRIYFDLAGAATDEAIESLLTITEPSHILYGSDYPYVAAPALIGAKKALEGRLAAHGLAPEDILTNNAKSLFNLQ